MAHNGFHLLLVCVAMTGWVRGAAAAQAPGQAGAQPRPEDTEIWEPKPPVVTPGSFAGEAPPSDAVVLFDGKAAPLLEAGATTSASTA